MGDLRARAVELSKLAIVGENFHEARQRPGSAKAIEAALLQFASEALTEQAAEINSWIKPGDIGGNGLDKSAQRNGLILAYNATINRASALRSPEPSGVGVE